MKDPAFLFYSSDFISGTMTMTDDQIGKYIRLLCLQHQKGFLTKKDMIFICKSDDEDILSKFVVLDDGNYYNLRLKEEVERRKKYSESRSNNRTGKGNKEKKHIKNISKTYDQHMETETITKTITEINKEKGVKGEKTIKTKYAEFVEMTPDEHLKLVNEFGGKGTEDIIEILNNYKGSKGAKYKSDYLAIKNWVIDRYKESLIKRNGVNGTKGVNDFFKDTDTRFVPDFSNPEVANQKF